MVAISLLGCVRFVNWNTRRKVHSRIQGGKFTQGSVSSKETNALTSHQRALLLWER